jgi:ubiquinone biosynthesis protein
LLRYRDNVVAGLRRSFVIAAALARLLVATGVDVALRRDVAVARFAVRLRSTLEYLGPTFIKFGQFLAVRFDLLPFDVCRSLEALFENVQRLSFDDVRGMIESELRAPLATVFPSFESDPVAAASLAQVHVARTADGVKVAVKVQRPRVAETIRTDLRIMRRLAQLADALGAFGAVSSTEMIDQFVYYAQREVDFVEEGRTADVLRRNAAYGEIIPVVYWDFTTSKILTLEFIEGVSLAELADRARTGQIDAIRDRLPRLQLPRVLHNMAASALHQLFVSGFFHGDPHPGNIIVCADNRIALVDFGIAGYLTERDRQLLRRFLGFLALGNFDESFRHYAQLFQPTEDTDLASFRRQAIALMRQWRRLASDASVAPELRLAGRFSDRMSTLVRTHRLRMSMDTLLFWRVLITLDSTALRFTAHFDLLHELRTFFLGTQVDDFMQAFTAQVAPDRQLAEVRERLADGIRAGEVLRQATGSTPLRTVSAESPHAAAAAASRTVRLTIAIVMIAAIAPAAHVVRSWNPSAALALVVAALIGVQLASTIRRGRAPLKKRE